MSDIDPTEGVAVHVGYVHGLQLTLGLCLCYTLCIACLRSYIRWRAYGRDDAVVLLSTVGDIIPADAHVQIFRSPQNSDQRVY